MNLIILSVFSRELCSYVYSSFRYFRLLENTNDVMLLALVIANE